MHFPSLAADVAHVRRPLRAAAIALVMLAATNLALRAQDEGASGAPAADSTSTEGAPGDSAAVDSATAEAAAEAAAATAQFAPPKTSKAFGHWETGRTLYQTTCQPCHGMLGEGTPAIGAPALNRQEPWYLLVQLRKFRAGIRGAKEDDVGGQMMAPMAMSLPDEQSLLDVAVYVASLEGPAPARTLRGDAVAGEKTFRTICTPCHGPQGAGRPEIRTPALIGQADWYIAGQLRKFRRGLRGYHDDDISGMQMRGMAAALATDKNIVDVATYLASLSK